MLPQKGHFIQIEETGMAFLKISSVGLPVGNGLLDTRILKISYLWVLLDLNLV